MKDNSIMTDNDSPIDNDNHSHLDNVNYSYYIERAEKLIRKIETEGKARKVVTNPNQLSLF